MKSICDQFPITSNEWLELDLKFEKLLLYAAWQLLKKNTKNNHTDEIEDIAQELRSSLIRAASYYKRQIYIESCFDKLFQEIKDEGILAILTELEDLWDNRTRHGAGKIKFGEYQEEVLEILVEKYLKEADKPKKNKPLAMDTKFITYCKAIAWNAQKSMGKKITREKSWRSGLVSLSEFSHLGSA